jgi:hypothetical protein
LRFAAAAATFLAASHATFVRAVDEKAAAPTQRSGAASDQSMAGTTHHFKFRPPVVGRSAEQEVAFSLQLTSTTVQGGVTVDEVESKLTRRQIRVTEVLAIEDGRVTKARVTYRVAEQQTSGKRRDGGAIPVSKAAQAVAGKTYIVWRAKPDDVLSIADEHGRQPPEEERTLVAGSLDAIGRINALGKFLDGRVLRVGQRIEIPRDAAREMLGFDKAMGQVAKFEMTLSRVANRGETPCGEFDTSIELTSPDADGQSTRFHGRMVVEVGACHSIEADFAGPVSFVENRSVAQSAYQVRSVGVLRVQMTSSPAKTDRTAAKPGERANR